MNEFKVKLTKKIEPNRWELFNSPKYGLFLNIEKRLQRDGSYKFVVKDHDSSTLHKKYLSFMIESKSDLDNDSYVKNTRFDTLEEAYHVFKLYIDKQSSLKKQQDMRFLAIVAFLKKQLD